MTPSFTSGVASRARSVPRSNDHASPRRLTVFSSTCFKGLKRCSEVVRPYVTHSPELPPSLDEALAFSGSRLHPAPNAAASTAHIMGSPRNGTPARNDTVMAPPTWAERYHKFAARHRPGP